MKIIPQLPEKQIERFWSKVDKDSNKYPALENPDLYSHVVGNCWEWTGGKDKDGYGNFFLSGQYRGNYRSHRVAYTLQHGKDPGNLLVCHHCDNPSCNRGDHLYLGTTKHNAKDREERLRSSHIGPTGELNGSAILTEVEVKQFFHVYNNTNKTLDQLALEFKVSKSQLGAILAGNKWKHLKLFETRKKRVRSLEPEIIKEIYYRYWTENVSQTDLAKEYDMDQTHVGQITRQFIWKDITDTVVLPFKLEKRNGKLTDEQVVDIFIRYNADPSQRRFIAKEYNISVSNVDLIGKRASRRSVTDAIAI
jgi:hypothetical protein